MNLSIIDWAIVIIVLAGMVYSVSFTKGLMRSVTDFLSAGRTAGRYLISVSQGAAGLGAISIVGFLEVGFITGFSFQWWGLSQGIILLALTTSGWVIYRFRQTRSLTLAQFFEKRYSRNFRIFAGIVAFVCGIINFGIFPAVGAQFFISYCGFPDSIFGIPTFPLMMIFLISIALYFVYTGGQIAVIIADFFQGVFLIVVLFIITIFLYNKVEWDQVSDSLKNTPVKLAAEEVDKLNNEEWKSYFGLFVPFPNSFKSPLALCYHGHQFGSYNPYIGDGRGFLYAQLIENKTKRLMDLGTKGSGKTPFSRSGDGRLTLKGAFREVLASEYLIALGVNTCKILSVFETEEKLQRQDEPSPARAAVLVRLSHSHIRIGSFQRLAYFNQHDEILKLARYVVKYYYPKFDYNIAPKELLKHLLKSLVENVAEMVAGWMSSGFVHGVLNTDNFNLTGESFDYGPWRFLVKMDFNFTAAYFDHDEIYSYGKQPEAALWALCRFADCLVEFVSEKELEKELFEFYPKLQ